MTTSSGRSSTTLAVPRFATPRRPERPTFGPQIALMAKRLGAPLMPWQSDFADVLGEYDPDTGIPFYSTAFYTVPRQSGKTVLMLAWVVRLVLTAPDRRVVWSAQSQKEGREKWTDDLYPMLERSKVSKQVRQLGRGFGNEKMSFTNGSVCRLVAPGADTGHGKTIHGSAEDEIMADETNWRAAAFGPAMSTVDEAQTLKTSTAGTAASTIYNQLRKAGREAVAEGRSDGICYLEYSADKDWDFLDPSTYRRHMPAVGFTQSERKILSLIEDTLLDEHGGPDEVRRAYGNISAGFGEGTIPLETWGRVCSSTVEPRGVLCFGVAVSEDRSSAAIVAADGSGSVELVQHGGGTGWVVDRCNELTARNPGSWVVLDKGGPAGSLHDLIGQCEPMSGSDAVNAHGLFFDAVVERVGIAVRSHPVLDKAVEGAVKKSLGDRWVWSRKASTEDVTPLEAATFAWAAARAGRSKKPPPAAMHLAVR